MHQNHISLHTTPAMASSHSYTVVDDEDDTDICPVCDGQCTCRIQPLSMAELSLKCQSTPPTPTPTPVTSLKIKFTLPPSLVAKRRLGTINDQQTTSASAQDAYTTPLKRRGRPTKLSPYNSKSASPIKTVAKVHKFRQNLKARTVFSKKVVKHKRVVVQSDQDLKKRLPTTHLNSNWVIRPRQKSVAGSDAEHMDVDTDATTGDDSENQYDHDQDEDQDDEDSEDDEDEDDPDALNGLEEDDARHRYVGLATGWSEEEDESSFDADLFFANLSSSSSSSDESTTSARRRCRSYYTPGGIDESSSTSESPARTTLETLPFEVTENWDGQLIFTNGREAESRGIVDINFELDTERFIIDSDADDDDDTSSSASYYGPYHYLSSIAQAPKASDIDMSSISDTDAGYEEDGGADEGDTTDEELVGDDSLPNERAMRLFTLPMPISMGISAINPMSTVSPSIGLERRGHARRGRGMDVDGHWEERKRWACFDSMVGKGKGKHKPSFSPSSPPSSSSHADYPRLTQTPSTPRTGFFLPTGETRQAVIGNNNKGTDIPSPHPRFYGKKGRVSVVQYLLKKHLQQQQSHSQSRLATPVTASTTNSVSSASIISDTPSSFLHLLSSSAGSPLTGAEDLVSTTSTTNTDGYDTPCPVEPAVDDEETTCIVDLDDLLDASFLDDSMDQECQIGVGSSSTPNSVTNPNIVKDSSTPLTTATTTSSVDPTEEASNKHLTRWDAISIGAFRQTREQQQQAWAPESRSSAVDNYGGMMKSGSSAGSPLSALMWQHSDASKSSTGAASSKKSSSSIPTSISSVSHSHTYSRSQPKSTTPHKNRKELRREKRLLKKKISQSQSPSSQSMPQHPPFFSAHPNNAGYHYHQYHIHQHHPNSKTRGTRSSQRTGFFGGAAPPLNL